MAEPPYEELWRRVRSIPFGRVVSYGELGRALRYPASGYMVGRWMANCPADVPWWRVVAKDGHLPLAKQSPDLANDQEMRLTREGVTFEGGLVSKTAFVIGSDLTIDD